MARYRYTFQKVPADLTTGEARRLPTFYRVVKVSRPPSHCEDCREHMREPWIDGSACYAHKVEETRFAADNPNAAKDALLALKVLRAGGNPEPRFSEGSLGAAQFSYRRPARKSDREAKVHALTFIQTTAAIAA
jgi:hypothetical protein